MFTFEDHEYDIEPAAQDLQSRDIDLNQSNQGSVSNAHKVKRMQPKTKGECSKSMLSQLWPLMGSQGFGPWLTSGSVHAGPLWSLLHFYLTLYPSLCWLSKQVSHSCGPLHILRMLLIWLIKASQSLWNLEEENGEEFSQMKLLSMLFMQIEKQAKCRSWPSCSV